MVVQRVDWLFEGEKFLVYRKCGENVKGGLKFNVQIGFRGFICTCGLNAALFQVQANENPSECSCEGQNV